MWDWVSPTRAFAVPRVCQVAVKRELTWVETSFERLMTIYQHGVRLEMSRVYSQFVRGKLVSSFPKHWPRNLRGDDDFWVVVQKQAGPPFLLLPSQVPVWEVSEKGCLEFLERFPPIQQFPD
jgi:hypothetical protein